MAGFGQKDWKLIKQALKFVRPYKISFIVAFFCVLSGIGFGVLQPIVFAKIVKRLVDGDFQELKMLLLYLAGLHILETFVGFLKTYIFAKLNNKIVYDLKKEMYQKILNLPVKAFDDNRAGDFITRLNVDSQSIATIVTTEFIGTIVDVLKVFIFAFCVFKINFILSIITLAVFPINCYIIFKYSKILRNKQEEIAILNDNCNSDVDQTISGIREIKALNLKKFKLSLFKSLIKKFMKKNVSVELNTTLSYVLSQSLHFITQIIVIGVSGYLIFKKQFDIEGFIAFTSLSDQFSNSLMNITQMNSNIQKILTALSRILGLIDDSMEYKEEVNGKVKIDKIKGDITFKNVTFSYDEKNIVLKNISLNLKAKGIYSFVGSSGSGKTTIFNILTRFYEINKGEVLIDKVNINEYEENSYKKNIAIVRQDPFLFNISIFDNLLISSPDATISDIHKVCEMVNIHKFILSLPNGYNTIVGENGVNLSGGQKQRIAIARVLLKKTRIILFDEATSALDNQSQNHIMKVIKKISKDHTILIIAHRLSTIIDSDKIIILRNGKIEGIGQHDDLISSNETYKNLYESELKRSS